MFTFTARYLLKLAYSKTTLAQIRTQFQGKPNFPESDEELFDILAVLESWIPQSVRATKAKPYLTYLCKKYITALAAAKYTRLPQSLEDFIVEQF